MNLYQIKIEKYGNDLFDTEEINWILAKNLTHAKKKIKKMLQTKIQFSNGFILHQENKIKRITILAELNPNKGIYNGRMKMI